MQDVVYMAVLVAFFGVIALFVVACDRIIGPDGVALAEEEPGAHTAPRQPQKAAA